ncbi:hypothetical protein BU251_08655 [Candidatus Velamenicoccus archaeovorus]|uniref:Uncharacterized protein n=1 Tax=Velamenicoccus archaeovorus TaxID=1930593 RepID=A0A410P751_VELA1|nr:radical SAM protein [Candidatus Velamenicoccus archaeovorus]QAT17784.1 hypothetical protein BU251_08655 [Candidatus Velamenicoccus archaeovorus]
MAKNKKIFLRSTYPECTRNLFDTTRFYNYFRENGFQLVRNPSFADVIVLTTCGFDRIKEDRTMRMIRQYYEKYPKKEMIVCGCLASTRRGLGAMFARALIVPVEQYGLFDNIFHPRISLDVIRTNALTRRFFARGRAVVRSYCIHICEGCLNNCTYCDYKEIRSCVKSKPPAEVISEFHDGLKAGYKRIVLLADDCGSYGVDKNTDFAKLLNLLAAFRNKDFRLSINFFEPQRLARLYPAIDKEIIRQKVAEMCIPLQSCSPGILKRMNRHYDVKDVLKIIDDIRRLNPAIHLITHIIYGFPGETRQDLAASFQLADHFDEVNYFCYLDKPEMRAFRLDRKVPRREIWSRTRMIQDEMKKLRRAGRPCPLKMAYTDREIRMLWPAHS